MFVPIIVSLFLWALRDAAREGNLVKVMDLVLDGVSVHSHQYLEQRSPLHEACRYGHLNIVKYLLENTDASAMATEKYALSTPLHEACIGGHIAVVDYLLSQGKADLYYLDKSQKSALHKASAAGHVDMCRYLITHGDQGLPGTRMVDLKDKDARTPLHEAAQAGHAKVVQFLVTEARARLHDQTITGDTPMHLACANDRVEVVKFLLGSKARLDIRNLEGLTPLDCAQVSNSAALLICLEQWTNRGAPIVDKSTTAATSPTPPTPKPQPIMSDPALPNGARSNTRPDIAQVTTEEKITGTASHYAMSEAPSSPPPPVVPTPPAVPPPATALEPAVPASPPPAVVTAVAPPSSSSSPPPATSSSVQTRLAQLEQRFSLSFSGSVQERLAALETEVLGRAGTGTVSARLSRLESELVDWQRVVALEVSLEITPRKEGSLLERITDLELELLGQSFGDAVTARLGRLENATQDWSRVQRLELELGLPPRGSRLERIAAIEQELFGEVRGGTTIASRLSRVEAELFGA